MKTILVAILICLISFSAGPALGSYVIPNGSVTTIKLADGAVSQTKLYSRTTAASATAGNVAVSGLSGGFSTNSNADYVQIDNQSVTLVTTGRPVIVMAVCGGDCALDMDYRNSQGAFFGLFRNGTRIYSTTFALNIAMPLLTWIDIPAAGSQVYSLRVYNPGTYWTDYKNMKLLAYEL